MGQSRISKIERARVALRRFTDREDGSILIFSMFLLVGIFIIGGLAVDFMRIETERAKMQSTVDRAVLAAADLDQTLSPANVVKDYLAKAGLTDTLVGEPTVSEGLNYRIVSAKVQDDVPMFFGGLSRIFSPNARVHTSMTVPASATAQERVARVEISMVLDISGSMSSNSRIQNLRTAATDFVTTVLDEESSDLVSVSLVPYSEHVALSADLFNAMKVNKTHSYASYCLEFADSDFATTTMHPNTNYNQVQHFQWVNNSYNDMSHTVCPTVSYAPIMPWSQSQSDLTTRIAQLQPYSQTAIYLGMKWGVGLLDPSMNPVMQTLISKNKVDAVFADRPTAYTATDTLKFVILMTDGENTSSYRIQDWAYSTDSYKENWARYNLIWYLNRYVSSRNRSQYYYQKADSDYGDDMLEDICDAAKNAGIIVWTIGFETSSHGAEVMEDCASSPSHYFDVEGIEISDAFHAIATQINNLKLTR